MKVILIRGISMDPGPHDIAKILSQNGYDVKLLVWDRQNTLKIGNDEGYTICRFNFKAPYFKVTALFYFPIWWAYVFFFLLKENCDVIHACDLDTLIPAVFAKLIKRVKLCYFIYDFSGSSLPDGSFSLLRKFFSRLAASLEKFGIRFAEVLFLVDESRYEEVRGAKINKIVYIYNSPPDYLNTKQRPEANDKAEMVIFYAGPIVRLRGLEHMIKAVEDLDGVKLILAGAGLDKGLVEKASSQCKKVQYIGWLPSFEDVYEKTLEADIIFRFLDPKIPNSKYASPGKLFQAMMCQKPVIVSDGGSMSNIVRGENCGLVVPYGDVDAIKDAILKLKNNPNLRRQLAENGRKAYEEKYGWTIKEERLINAYKEIERGRTCRKK